MKIFESKTYQCAECLSVMEWVIIGNPLKWILRHPEEYMSGIGNCPNMDHQIEMPPEIIAVISECVPEHPLKTLYDSTHGR